MRAVVTVVLALALLACSSDGSSEVDGDEPATSTAIGERPTVDVGDVDGLEELRIEDLVEGDGAEATSGAAVTVHYVGVAASTGEAFDASWDRSEPFTFVLGAGTVIEGWDQGVAGMRVGGRRQLSIPPELGYGERGVPGAIAPDETLVFVVDLLEVS